MEAGIGRARTRATLRDAAGATEATRSMLTMRIDALDGNAHAGEEGSLLLALCERDDDLCGATLPSCIR